MLEATPEILKWLEGIIIVLVAVSGVIGKLFYSQRKAGKELTKVIDSAPLENEEFLKLAEKAGLKGAALVLSKLIK